MTAMPIRVAMLASECEPWAKTGGLADVVDAFPGDLQVLRADGGATANAFLMQLQADLLERRVEVAAEQESTALGAAVLAGLAVGVWRGEDEAGALLHPGAVFEPTGADTRALRESWALALRRTRLA